MTSYLSPETLRGMDCTQCPTCGKWGLLDGTWANDVESSRCAGCVKDPSFCSCR